ncbi:hypothetical protein Taro_011930 [Colocasia esculenta]|uniref:Uncharacterized protein n=1 Tax=Colocasia esculenta TaxID=4460 RepID=A0A843UHJ8_COLES|nr:hypothetical protein [Colocasia esculenta]
MATRPLQREKGAAASPSGGFRTPTGYRHLEAWAGSPLTDEAIWKRLREAGFDEEMIKRRDKAALIAYISKLEAEIYDYQHNMGLFILEKKELISKYEQVKASADSDVMTYKREQAAQLSALAESKKREENLKKALAIEKECIASVPLDLFGVSGIGWRCSEISAAGEVAGREPLRGYEDGLLAIGSCADAAKEVEVAGVWRLDSEDSAVGDREGTYPLPCKSELWMKLVGVPLLLCDGAGFVFIVQGFGKMKAGTLHLVLKGQLNSLEAIVEVQSPNPIPSVLLVVSVGGGDFTVRVSSWPARQQRRGSRVRFVAVGERVAEPVAVKSLTGSKSAHGPV